MKSFMICAPHKHYLGITRRMRWPGHTAGKGKKRKEHIVSVEQPDGNRTVRRP